MEGWTRGWVVICRGHFATNKMSMYLEMKKKKKDVCIVTLT